MEIPNVSIDDLKAFHKGHFSTDFKGPLLGPHASHHEDNDASISMEEEELNYIGSYPDGFPKTLTDEQIAMFRYSEVQTLRRERKQKKEAAQQEKLSSAVEKKTAQLAKQLAAHSPESEQGQTQSASNRIGSVRRHSGKRNCKPWTLNRQARELDEAKQETVELDY